MSETLIQFNDIYKYFGTKLVLEKINISIKTKSITTLIGPNGAGKSSLAKLILGITKPSSGKIYRKPKLKVGYIPQKIQINLNLPITGYAFLQYFSNTLTTSKEIESIVKFTKIQDFLNDQISNLSGGQLQKLLLAAAIINEPDLLVLDEATQGLDIHGQKDLYQIIEQCRQKFGMAIFMISHDLYTVLSKSSQVLCLNKHICCHGKPNNVMNHSEYIKIFGQSYDYLSPYSHNHNHTHRDGHE